MWKGGEEHTISVLCAAVTLSRYERSFIDIATSCACPPVARRAASPSIVVTYIVAASCALFPESLWISAVRLNAQTCNHLAKLTEEKRKDRERRIRDI